MQSFVLNSGKSMPLLGLGTFKIREKELVSCALEAALAAGYRSIDTAAVYRNEDCIGELLPGLLSKFGLKREDVFITSKLAPRDQGSGKCKAACLQSLSRLRLDYLDLMLIHWPGTQGLKHDDKQNPVLRSESWRDMLELYKAGKLRAIGVSNYTTRHMEELLSFSTVIPAVLQIECHPHLAQTELVDLCRERNILFQAYSSLGTTTDDSKLLNDPTVQKMALQYKKSPAQILLRWAVQQNIGVIPKSTNPQHIKENTEIFDFTIEPKDMDELSGLDQQCQYTWDPTTVI